MKYKTCTKCGEELEATTEFFHKQKLGKDGLKSQCKTCRSKNARELRRNPEFCEKANQRSREWRKNNPEKVRQYDREYRKNNPEKIKQRHRDYYENNSEEVLQTQLKHYHEQMKDPEFRKKRRLRGYVWYKNNLELCRQREREYCKNNPDKMAAKNVKRRALQLNQTPEFTESEEKRVRLIYKKSQELGSDYHVDHIQPLIKGGLHHPDNLQIVTKSYNLEKGAKLDFRLPTDEEIYNF